MYLKGNIENSAKVEVKCKKKAIPLHIRHFIKSELQISIFIYKLLKTICRISFYEGC